MNKGTKFLLTKLLYLKIFIAFSIGILAVEFIDKIYWILILIGVFISNLSLNYYFRVRRSKLQDNLFFSLIIVFGIGFHYYNTQYTKQIKLESIELNKGMKAVHILRLDEKPMLKKNSYKIEAKLLETILDTARYRVNMNVILYLSKDVHIDSLSYGSIIAIKSMIQTPRPSEYDFEFDYKKWLERRKIYATLYANRCYSIGRELSIWYKISVFPKRIRDYYESKIDQYVKEARSNEVAKSILIGVRTNMDKELLDSYSNTGAIHILSVSGLHFAILILFINWILGLFMRESKLKMGIKHCISFLYALITGFSPSVFRSFLMFLLLDVEKNSKVNPSAINIVFLSAWLILLYDSNQCFDIGFQLSYAAILGIILWQNRMKSKLQFDSELGTYLWKSTCTLVAATLFTMPFIIFYFHKMSFLGLLSNFLVIPLTVLTMYIGFILLGLSWIDSVGDFLGNILSFLVYIQNEIILWFSQIRFAVFDSFYLSKGSFFISILILFFLNLFLFLKSRYELTIMLLLVIIALGAQTYESIQNERKTEWYIVPTYKRAAFAAYHQGSLYVFSDSLESNADKFFINNLRISKGLSHSDIIDLSLHSYFKSFPMEYAASDYSKPKYLLLCRENKSKWQQYISRRDSFVLVGCLGSYYMTELTDELKKQGKHYMVK